MQALRASWSRACRAVPACNRLAQACCSRHGICMQATETLALQCEVSGDAAVEATAAAARVWTAAAGCRPACSKQNVVGSLLAGSMPGAERMCLPPHFTPCMSAPPLHTMRQASCWGWLLPCSSLLKPVGPAGLRRSRSSPRDLATMPRPLRSAQRRHGRALSAYRRVGLADQRALVCATLAQVSNRDAAG